MERKDIIRRAYDLFTEGKLAEAGELFAPDAVWSLPGHNAVSGDYRGRDAIMNDFLPKLAKLSGSTYRATLMDVAEGEHHCFALQHSQAQRDGQSIDYVICNVMIVKEGLIQAVHSYPYDAAAQDAFWTVNEAAALKEGVLP